jgi:sulfatase modifying factor 1
VLLATRPAFAQTPPVLSCQLYAGVNITGTTGSIYAVQATSNLANSNSWRCVALVQLPATNYLWVDTAGAAMSGQRFYRAVLNTTNFVLIQPGSFTMGSPANEALRGSDEIQHTVTISKGFFMDRFLVTQGEYLATVGTNPSSHTGNLNYPVENVSWVDATNYCALRTVKEQSAGLIPTNWVYRLPTESEWEYVSRAGTTAAFYLGSALHSHQANFVGTNEYDSAVGNIFNPSGENLQQTTVVGAYPPNAWGLYDMEGNVFEFCQDWYGTYPSVSITDPQGPATGGNRVRRGGSFNVGGMGCRSARRYTFAPAAQAFVNSFRVVLAQQ